MKIPWHHTILMRRGRRPPPKPRGGGSRKAAAKGENGKWTPAPRKHVKHITLGRGAEQRRCMWYSDQYLAWLDRISECRSTRKDPGPEPSAASSPPLENGPTPEAPVAAPAGTVSSRPPAAAAPPPARPPVRPRRSAYAQCVVRDEGEIAPLGRVTLNAHDKHVDFIVNDTPNGGRALRAEVAVWAGCRANFGAKSGKVAFSLRMTSGGLCRVGFSTASASLNLGHDDQSFGFGSTGKKSHGNAFSAHGEAWGAGDTITCLLDADAGTISYLKNGQALGAAHTIPSWLRAVPLYPHVLTKDAAVTLNFAAPSNSAPLPEGFSWLEDHAALCPSPWAATGAPPAPRDDPEEAEGSARPVVPFSAGPSLAGVGPQQKRLVMLVGLPCSGKTYWAKKFMRSHPELRFQMLSTNLIMERMMPNTKHSYQDRWDKMIGHASAHLTAQIELVSGEAGNIIWDQTNVFPNARNRKLKQFKDFHKTAVVFLPSQENLKEWRQRQWEQTGQRVPDKTVAQMQAAFTLPEIGDEAGFDEVIYAFGNRPEERRQLLAEYKKEAEEYRAAGQKRKLEGEGEEAAPQPKGPRKDSYLKSYADGEFVVSNPYQPRLPIAPAQQALPPDEKQLALLRDAKVDAYVPPTPAEMAAAAAKEAPVAPAATKVEQEQEEEEEAKEPEYEFAVSSVGAAKAKQAA